MGGYGRRPSLQKLRGEPATSFAHCYETGGMRRLYLRGSDNALKRVLLHVAAFNLGLLLRKLSGWGKPRQAQGRLHRLLALFFTVFAVAVPAPHPRANHTTTPHPRNTLPTCQIGKFFTPGTFER